jgi:hypothetical protein
MFLMWINLFTQWNLRRKYVSSLRAIQGLSGAISQQNRNAIHDRIKPPTALASYARCFKLQGLVADGADNPAQILFRQ